MAEPYERPDPGNRDETAWLWSIARSRAERGSVVFAITGSTVGNIEGGEADVPRWRPILGVKSRTGAAPE